jgi:hypothetical protein
MDREWIVVLRSNIFCSIKHRECDRTSKAQGGCAQYGLRHRLAPPIGSLDSEQNGLPLALVSFRACPTLSAEVVETLSQDTQSKP